MSTEESFAEDSFVDFKCPHCGGEVSFPRPDAGHVRECPSCMEALMVPEDGAELGGKIPLPITTPRLILRRFQAGDWKDLLELDPEAGEDHVLNWLERDRQVKLTSPDQVFNLGVVVRESSKLVGYLSLRFTDSEWRQAVLQSSLDERSVEPALVLEAVDALLGFCFQGIKLHRVTAMCTSKDTAGCRRFEEVGMRREAEFVKDRLIQGEWVNSIWYAALDEEYEVGEK